MGDLQEETNAHSAAGIFQQHRVELKAVIVRAMH